MHMELELSNPKNGHEFLPYQIQVGINSSKHMDPMHQWITLHFLHLLPNSKVNATLRSVNARHRFCLQRHRSQHRCPVRSLIRFPCHQNSNWAVACSFIGLGPMLLGLFSYVGCCLRPPSTGAFAAHVLLYVRGGSCSEFL